MIYKTQISSLILDEANLFDLAKVEHNIKLKNLTIKGLSWKPFSSTQILKHNLSQVDSMFAGKVPIVSNHNYFNNWNDFTALMCILMTKISALHF